MVRNLTGQSGSMQKTDFSAATGTFDITNGVLHNTDFLFLGPLLRVVGAGAVDIGRKRQNFRLEPTAVSSLTGQGGALDEAGFGVFPVLITGTWSNPRFQPDLTAAIDGLLPDPGKTPDVIAGLAEGAGPGQAAEALLGAVTGGGEDSLTGALGQTLGGAPSSESGGGNNGSGEAGTAGGQSSGLGSLLGALGGGGGGGTDGWTGDGSVAQPSYGGTRLQSETDQPAIDAGGLAPLFAPVPFPADREDLAALPEAIPSTLEETPDESISVPALQSCPSRSRASLRRSNRSRSQTPKLLYSHSLSQKRPHPNHRCSARRLATVPTKSHVCAVTRTTT